ncbi:Gfo/Idh/MocA family protein [Paenibacillus sedimenti]|uniref:Gfo/Idh/MocA family oxidoreductase n=1 Tax=Paenibacillus sedimenti TaxID=2770274 RepID=A0A926KR75_9BACL|nr:Gfo/Idh/MocA family oxidoreductase [Paenibacillus sedimenti]MBD0381813.1 Gfo/Idh/MocA family oxidoreductase [Paenibacillus sedimenti]
MTKLRWGILGCAGIAIRACIPGIQKSETGVVTAIASRNLQKSQETAAQLDIPTAYGSYEELIADPNIDAVYIPLPNHLHKEWTIRAAQAGKHVLCEKPAALTTVEVEEMVAACESAGVLFAEAFMYRHHPRYERMKEIIASGEIGDVRGIHGTFTFNNPGDAKNVRFVKEWGGGSVYDVGCYPISAARLLLGREPEAVTTHAFFSPEHDDVDMMMSGLVEFSGSVALTFDCGMWANFRNTVEVLGTLGRIEVPSAFVTPTEESGHFIVYTAEGRREEKVPYLNQYALQADDLAYAAWGEKPLRFAPRDAVNNMKVIDACLQSARERSRIIIKQ